jgi:glycosyltransferase involved in cell wall biosynthesis
MAVGRVWMHLLMINYEYPPLGGGAANATYHIARSLSDRGHRIAVLTSGFKGNFGSIDQGAVRIYRCPAMRQKQWSSNLGEMLIFTCSAAVFLERILKRHCFDGAIVFFSLPCGPLGWLARWSASVPYVISLRGGDVPGNEMSLNAIHSVLKPFRRHIFRKCLRVVAPSSGLKRLAEKADPIKVDVIPNGVDCNFFSPSPKKEDHPFRFLFVGRFQAQKNLAFLLEQLCRLGRESPRDFLLHMVGDGPQKDSLKKLASHLGVKDRIVFHGWLNKVELRSIYQQAHCLLLPSIYEGLSNVILESMASALPVIASDAEGNRDMIEHGKTGLLFSLKDADDFFMALKHVLNDPEEGKQMGERARQEVLSAFSWDCVADRYAELFVTPVPRESGNADCSPMS